MANVLVAVQHAVSSTVCILPPPFFATDELAAQAECGPYKVVSMPEAARTSLTHLARVAFEALW